MIHADSFQPSIFHAKARRREVIEKMQSLFFAASRLRVSQKLTVPCRQRATKRSPLDLR